MKMHMDEDEGVMDIAIGMKFNSIDDLEDIQEKLRQAQSINGQSGQISAMKSGSPLGKFMGSDSNKVNYSFTENGFSRTTNITEEEGMDFESLIDASDETDIEFMNYFEASYYNVKLVFPKRIKSSSIKNAVISEDGKTLTYKMNWIEFLKDPKRLDVDVQFYE